MAQMIRVLGIDPGSIVTGYGVVDTDGVRCFHVAHGHIRTAGETFSDRLGSIHAELTGVINQWQPSEASIEQVFVSNNAMSALKLGQARGAAICAVVAHGIPVSEYPARTVKQSVVGSGGADKKQVQHMVKLLLNLEGSLQADAADGIAIALCHAHSRCAPGRSAGGTADTGSRRRSRSAKRWSASSVEALKHNRRDVS